MNIPHFRFIFLHIKIFGEIVTPIQLFTGAYYDTIARIIPVCNLMLFAVNKFQAI